MKEASTALKGWSVGFLCGVAMCMGIYETSMGGYIVKHELIKRGHMMYHPTTGEIVWTEEQQ